MMQRTRAQFKLSLRYCKQHEDMLCADALATAVSDRDYRQFWNKVHKTNNGRATKYSDTIYGCAGIVERWRILKNFTIPWMTQSTDLSLMRV